MSEMRFPAIVVIGYNRPVSLLRLLRSLARANYPEEPVTLVICLDYTEDERCRELAEDFEWTYGRKSLLFQTERLGLKNHVLKCGDLTEVYGSIIMLEDDIIVSPWYFRFAVEAQSAYESDSRVAGVALYSHQFNFIARAPFQPIPTGGSTFFLRFPCSWGQSWTANQWREFRSWLKEAKELHEDLPSLVRNWPDTSWLKWYASYCIEKQKTWVYPYQALSTNFGETGTNSMTKSTTFQVALVRGQSPSWLFPILDNSLAQYDHYFENCSPSFLSVIGDRDWEMDAYGTKPINHFRREFMVTTRNANHVLGGFSFRYKPFEANLLEGLPGNDLRLVLSKSVPTTTTRLSFSLFSFLYANRFTPRQLLRYLLTMLGVIRDKAK